MAFPVISPWPHESGSEHMHDACVDAAKRGLGHLLAFGRLPLPPYELTKEANLCVWDVSSCVA